MLTRAFLIALLLTNVLILGACTSQPDTTLAPGVLSPQFSLPTAKGELLSPAALRGNVVLLNFWASWCAPCREEVASLKALAAANQDQPFRILAIAVEDDQRAALNLVGEAPKNFLTVFDSNGKVRDLFRVQGFPESFVLDQQGRLLLFPDPERRQALLRIIGPRSWDSPAMVKRFRALLAARN